MKFNTETRDITSKGALMSRKITLSANAKAYRLLFGQIYPDIVKAIVREIFTNAWDSQKVAGTLDTPIQIHLPTDLEPWFAIRDFGTGMTPEVIDEVYTRVFESTKDDSNEEAGMFGMGSKTPLGYTNAFSVTSYVDGVVRAYDIFINTSGEAQLDLKYEGETEEPNGVNVQIGVLKEDFDNFKHHAETFALHAGTPIDINRKRVLNTRKELMSGENWTLYEENQKFEDAMFIRMGCVLYRLNTTMLFSNLSESIGWNKLSYTESAHIKQLFRMPLVIDFPIGSFEVTGSREDIVYTSESADKIFKCVKDEVIKEITDQISFDISNSATFGEAYRTANIYMRMGLISTETYRKLKWKSWPVSKAVHFVNHLTRSQFCYQPYSNRNDTIMRSFVTRSIDLGSFYDPDAITYIVIDDGKAKRTHSRLVNLCTQLSASGLKRGSYNANMYSTGKPKMFNILWVKKDELNWARLERVLPANYIVINIEDITPVPPKKREPKEEELDYDVYHIKDTGYELKLTRWTREPRSKYFVRSHRRRLLARDDDIRRAAVTLGINIKDIVVINKLSEHCIEHHDLLDLIKEADNVKDLISFNESTIFFHALDKLRDMHGNLRWFSYSKDAVAKLMKIDYKEEDVAENFSSEVNDSVNKQFNEMSERIVAYLEGLYVKYPIMKFVNVSSASNNEKLIELMTTLGEI